MKKPAVVTSGRIIVHAVRPPRKPHEFATRNCVRCAGELNGESSVRCQHCHHESSVDLCEHVGRKPAWRVVRWHRAGITGNGRRKRDIVAIALGDVTVFLGRFRDAVDLRGEDGTRLPLRKVRSIEVGAEVVERMTHVGMCYRCRTAFFLADCEITAEGPPRILRVPVSEPTRTYMRPMPDPVHMAAAYASLGVARPAELELEEP